MIKNGSPKQYTIGKDNVGKDLNKYLSDLIKQQKTTPEFTQMHGDNVRMHWVPMKDVMNVWNNKEKMHIINIYLMGYII